MSCMFARTVISNFGCFEMRQDSSVISADSSIEVIRADSSIGPGLLNQNFSWCMHLFRSRLEYCNSVLTVSVEFWNTAARWFGLKRFDPITPALMDSHWLPDPQSITYKFCIIMFKCLHGSAHAYLADYCTSTTLVPGRSALRSAAHGDIVVPSHRTDWGLRSFAVAGSINWNVLPAGLRSSFF